MKKRIIILLLGLAAGCQQPDSASPVQAAASAPAVQETGLAVKDVGLSKVALTDTGDPLLFERVDIEPGDGAVPERSWDEAPPVIAHSLEDLLPITFSENQCIDCHAVDEKEEGEPTPIPESHYVDLREAPGAAADDVAGARYNCMLCHSIRTDAEPLVANEFEK